MASTVTTRPSCCREARQMCDSRRGTQPMEDGFSEEASFQLRPNACMRVRGWEWSKEERAQALLARNSTGTGPEADRAGPSKNLKSFHYGCEAV